MSIAFHPSQRSTLGVEWELALIERRSGELIQVAETILQAVQPEGGGEHPTIKQELLLNTIEIITGVHRTVRDAKADLAHSIDIVQDIIDPMGVALFSAGTHPFAQWYQQKVTDADRYARLIERTQWWGRQMLIYGVHVHVGIDHRDKVLPILNALLTYFPHLQALSASSPFWGGENTGYASNRALMFQQLPTAGLPFQFDSWPAYEHYVDDMLKTGVIHSLKENRWDIRPSPQFGTIEVRVCDGLPSLLEVGAIAALVHCLVDDFAQRLDDGETLPTLPPWFVQENKWRSARYGLEAEIILDAEGNERLVTEDIRALLERLEPVAKRLDCVNELRDTHTILKVGASYQRQLRVAEQYRGSLKAVVASLAAEFRDGILAGDDS